MAGDSHSKAAPLSKLIYEALVKKVKSTDLDKLPLEALIELNAAFSSARMVNAAPKEECSCEVVSVDDDPKKTTGWQCRCFKLANPARKIASFRGPGFTNWVGGSGGGTSPAGNPTENVVEPVTGEAFAVEYKCKCKEEAV